MKKIPGIRTIVVAFALAMAPLVSTATTFFSDNFTGASTLNQPPTDPTGTSTSYETYIGLTNGIWGLTSGCLSFSMPNTSSVLGEVLARFTNSPISLATVGDNVAVTVVFTNALNILSGTAGNNSTLNIGLYYSGGVSPNQGNIVGNQGNVTGGTEDWVGYCSRIFWNPAGSCTVFTRPAQTPNGTTSQNQDLLFNNASSTQGFNNPLATNCGSTTLGGTNFAQGGTYTLYMSITLTNASPFAYIITNTLYRGAGTGGDVMFTQAKPAVDSTFITSGFDAFAFGWRNSSSGGQTTTVAIASIQVSGQSSGILPPTITAQPVAVTVATNATSAFFVTGSGVALSYQWKRNGTNLLNGGNISGATTPTLAISSAGPADVFTNYYVTVSNPAGSVNSATNYLTLRQATNLVWSGSVNHSWDVNTTANWLNPDSAATTFNYGDPVTFNDSAALVTINLMGQYLSPASITMDASVGITLQGSGSIAGTAKLMYRSAGQLSISSANSYSGGTIVSNAGALLYLANYSGLGSGPVTFAKAGGKMEIEPTGAAGVGIQGDLIVNDDFTIQLDGSGAYSGNFLGGILGTSGKTLTLSPKDDGTTNRFRVYSTNMVCDVNLVLNGTSTIQANYFGSCLAPYHSTGSQTYNGLISGNGGLVQRDSGTTILKAQNTYAGGTWVTQPGPVAFGADTTTNGSGTIVSGPIGTGPLFVVPEVPNNVTGSGQVIAWGGARTIHNPIQYPSATNSQTLIVGGTNALTFTGPINLNGLDGIGGTTGGINLSNRIFQVTNTALTTFSGVISDGGGVYGLVKSGNGVLALNNAETYTGPTLVSNGTLQVNGTLDAASAVTVCSNGILAGIGTINGSVLVQSNGTLAPGKSIGTLTIANNLTVNGNLSFELNKGGSPANDVCSVSGTLANGGVGKLTVSNSGTTLAAGNKFYLFNKGMTGAGALYVVGAGVTWANTLAADGSITVSSTTVPTPAFSTITIVNSTNITFDITNAPLGYDYYVLATTNLTLPITNWTRLYTNQFTASNFQLTITNAMPRNIPNRFYLLSVF